MRDRDSTQKAWDVIDSSKHSTPMSILNRVEYLRSPSTNHRRDAETWQQSTEKYLKATHTTAPA